MPPASKPITPAWSGHELDNPHDNPEKADKVRRMFAAIARAYDLNNRVHSLGLDQRWRRAAVRHAHVTPDDRVLDVACGTGDLTHAFARAGPAEVVGLDFTPQMLDIARHKLRRIAHTLRTPVRYVQGDATSLPFPDHAFTIVSIAFGLRNLHAPSAGIAEFARVLAPGGRLVILEFDTPPNPILRRLHNFYTGTIMPRTASLLARDRSGAYFYLPRSVRSFIPAPQLCDLLRNAGFSDVRHRPLSAGICACYSARRDGR